MERMQKELSKCSGRKRERDEKKTFFSIKINEILRWNESDKFGLRWKDKIEVYTRKYHETNLSHSMYVLLETFHFHFGSCFVTMRHMLNSFQPHFSCLCLSSSSFGRCIMILKTIHFDFSHIFSLALSLYPFTVDCRRIFIKLNTV